MSTKQSLIFLILIGQLAFACATDECHDSSTFYSQGVGKGYRTCITNKCEEILTKCKANQIDETLCSTVIQSKARCIRQHGTCTPEIWNLCSYESELKASDEDNIN